MKGNKAKQAGRLRFKRERQREFDLFMALARAGDEGAISDLWQVYGFDFRAEAQGRAVPQAAGVFG